MLKLLIIDDEQPVREGLKTIINWEKYGFRLCGEAENGIEGLKVIEEMRPDLVVTDIRMPGMDGLEMVKAFREKGADCRIIILTGYSEFQYAKQAIALGVESYLLKPIDEEELIAQVEKLHADIVKQKSINDFLTDSITITRDKIIEELLSRKFDEAVLNRANQMYNLKLPWKSYQVLLIDTNDNIHIDRDINALIRKEMDEFVTTNNYGYVFESGGRLGIILKDVSFDVNIKPLEFMCNMIKERLGMDILISIGSCTDNKEEVGLSFERAFNLIKNKFTWGSQKIVGYNKDIINGMQKRPKDVDLKSISQKLYMAVDINNKENIGRLLEELGDGLLARDADEASIKTNFINVYVEIMNRLMMNNEELKNLDLKNEIYIKRNIDELKEYVREKLSLVSDDLARTKPDTPIKKILDYIQRNYGNDIKIESLAQMFGYNSIYLGQLFKSHTGKYFNTYLEHVRIEKAKQLLKEGLKVYQVAERIGYHNLDYFSSKFKKYVGVSPSEYREGNGQ